MNLGDLADTLATMPADAPVMIGADPVRELGSWRGRYDEASLFTQDGVLDRIPAMTVADLLAEVQAALNGKGYEGYKGGTFTFGRSTPVWADEYGESRGRMVAGLSLRDDVVVVATFDGSDYI